MPPRDPIVMIDEYTIKSVKSFTYLGSRVNSNATLDNELSLRIAKASSAFGFDIDFGKIVVST